MTIQSINAEILAGGFTNDQLNSIGDAIKFARSRLADQTKRKLTVGAQVKFNNTKRGVTMTGTVNKIAIKYVTVSTQGGLWRVPASMLETV